MKARVRYHLDINTQTMDARKLRQLAEFLRGLVEVSLVHVPESIVSGQLDVAVTFDSATERKEPHGGQKGSA